VVVGRRPRRRPQRDGAGAALDAAPGHGAVELVSFERDLDALALALAHPRAFPHLRHPAPHRLLARRASGAPGLTWTLVRGDALDALADAPAPDVIWWDPFSPKVDARCGPAAFARSPRGSRGRAS
jgi:hypothetical protein